MTHIITPSWIQALTTEEFDSIFQENLLRELKARKHSLTYKLKTKIDNGSIVVSVVNADNELSNKKHEDELTTNLEASSGVKFIVAEAIRDAVKKTIEQLKGNHPL